MGITSFEIKLLEKYIDRYNPKNVIEAGSQNLYITSEPNPPFADTFYKDKGVDYMCIDLAGDNHSLQLDLAYPIDIKDKFDLVTNFGTGEHVVQMDDYETMSFHHGNINSVYPIKIKNIELGFYNLCLNIHNLCKTGGIVICVNPLTDNWKNHGYSYITEQFYRQLQSSTEYEILELGLNAGSGNEVDGWNVYCVMKKHSDKFPSFEEFSTFDIYKN